MPQPDEYRVRVMVTMRNMLTFDELMSPDEAKAFFPWLSQNYGDIAGACLTVREGFGIPVNYEALGRPRIDKPIRERIRTEFNVYFHTTYTAQGRRPF